MLELTRTPHTEGLVQICAVVPMEIADAVSRAIAEVAEPNVSIEDAFPEKTPGMVLRGARGLRGVTQLQLASIIGVRASTISDMERDRRPIGKAMAKKLGEALDFSYRAFL